MLKIFRWLVEAARAKKQSLLSNELVTTDIPAEAAPFTFPLKRSGEEMRVSAMTHIPSLLNKVLELLEQYARLKIEGGLVLMEMLL